MFRGVDHVCAFVEMGLGNLDPGPFTYYVGKVLSLCNRYECVLLLMFIMLGSGVTGQ